MKKILANNDAFTLVEAVIAMMILSVGLMGTAVMQISSIQNNYSASNMTEATTRGLDQMEQILSWAWGDPRLAYTIASNNYRRVGPRFRLVPIFSSSDFAIASDKYMIYWNVTSNVGQPNFKNIRVDVVWRETGNQLKTITMDLVKTRF